MTKLVERAAVVVETIDERLVDRAVGDLRRLVMNGQVDLVSRVGEYLIESFFDGSVEAARSKSGSKPASLRRLSERAAEFGMSSAGVMNAVPIALQVREIGKRLASQLLPSHHRALLPVRDRKEKRQLAEAAVAGGWSVTELRKKVGQAKKRHAGGRPKRATVSLLIARVDRLFEIHQEKLKLEDGLDEMTPPEARILAGQVERLQRQLERVEHLLARVITRHRPAFAQG